MYYLKFQKKNLLQNLKIHELIHSSYWNHKPLKILFHEIFNTQKCLNIYNNERRRELLRSLHPELSQSSIARWLYNSPLRLNSVVSNKRILLTIQLVYQIIDLGYKTALCTPSKSHWHNYTMNSCFHVQPHLDEKKSTNTDTINTEQGSWIELNIQSWLWFLTA